MCGVGRAPFIIVPLSHLYICKVRSVILSDSQTNQSEAEAGAKAPNGQRRYLAAIILHRKTSTSGKIWLGGFSHQR